MGISVPPKRIVSDFKTVLKNYFELFVLALFLILCLICVFVFRLQLIYPSKGQAESVSIHYIYPLLVAVVSQFILIFLYKMFRFKSFGLSLKENLISFLYLPYIALSMFLHFNIKAWTPLINPNTYDAFYYKSDHLTPIPEWLSAIGKSLDIGGNFSSLYLWIFIFMFALSFILHSTFDNFTNFRKVVVGTCLVLLLGGVSYWIAPAVGPFIYENSKLAGFPEAQKGMYKIYSSIVATGNIPKELFNGSLAAMPSLHVANSLFFLLCARRSLRWLQVLYIPLFIFIVIVAVASKFHYVIDLIFGALLSVFVYWLVNKIYD